MKVYNIHNFKNWFIGNFFPTLYKTPDFEVSYRDYKKGELHEKHYHKIAKEVNVLVRGRLNINDRIVKKDEIFVIEPGEWADIKFLTNCSVFCVKWPSCGSNGGDKYFE